MPPLREPLYSTAAQGVDKPGDPILFLENEPIERASISVSLQRAGRVDGTTYRASSVPTSLEPLYICESGAFMLGKFLLESVGKVSAPVRGILYVFKKPRVLLEEWQESKITV
jgi:hypothetical protein